MNIWGENTKIYLNHASDTVKTIIFRFWGVEWYGVWKEKGRKGLVDFRSIGIENIDLEGNKNLHASVFIKYKFVVMTYPTAQPEALEKKTVFDRIRALPSVPVSIAEIVAWGKGEEPEYNATFLLQNKK